ncbi:MAG TPA: protein kinase [Vicinamibacterales bacterium]|nr:protein kinase [Vicinamibacterales bacterium]
MALNPGTRLGAYEIVGAIGAGGMGEVYKARDVRLNRDVAVKLLPNSFAGDSDRITRFQREAQVLASLNHPNIAQVYDVGHLDAASYLVMELVDGEDLSAVIARGAMAPSEVLPIAKQMALALEAAHEQGIIHRDLKPANIKVRADGTVKVLDFGLAKALEPAAAASIDAMNSPTLTNRATEAGIILGTAAYMAPEQAKGRPVDKRADIWAFGCVLHEMLTGRRAFHAQSVAETLGLIFARDASVLVNSLPPGTPAALRSLIARCLVKDPRERLRDVGDGRQLIDDAIAGRGEPVTTEPTTDRRVAWFRRVSFAGLLALVAIAASASFATWLVTRPAVVPTPHMEFSVLVPTEAPVRRNTGVGVAISPNGRFLTYVAEPLGGRATVLYLRRLDTLGVKPIEGTSGAFAPFFSPDSRWIGFFTDQHVMRVPVAGGTPMRVTDKGRFSRAAWMGNDTIVLGTSQAFRPGALATVPATGGTPTDLTTLGAGELIHQLPHPLPDGRHLLFSVHGESGAQLAVTEAGTRTHRLLGLVGSDVRYVEPGSLIFARGTAMFEAPFDLGRLQVTGPETGILPGADVFDFGLGISIGLFDIDRVGNIAYVPTATSRTSRLIWMDASGRQFPIGLEPARYSRPRISRDGSRFVVSVVGDGMSQIRVVDIKRGLPLDLETQGSDPIWAPDGTITFAGSTRRGPVEVGRFLARTPVDTGAPPATLLQSDDRVFIPEDWAPNGSRLLFSSSSRLGRRGLVDRNLEVLVPGAPAKPLVDSPADESNGRISPDGKWLAYQATSSGRSRIYVRPFDRPGGTQTVSGEGGTSPVWARDGAALFFVEGGMLMRAPIAVSPFAIGHATALFPLPGSTEAFDVAPDGRFVILLDSAVAADEIRVVLGWPRGIRAR